MKKISNFEDIKKEIKEMFNYTIIDTEYINRRTKMSFIDVDGYKYYSSISNLYRVGYGNPFHTLNPYTLENIKNWMKLNNRTDTLISTEYISNGTKNRKHKLQFICQKGHRFDMTWSGYHQGRGCPKCVRRYEDREGYIETLQEMYKDEYIILGDYVNSQTKTLMKHTKCGHEWLVTPNSMTQGHGCPKCSHKRGKEHYRWNPNLTEEDRKNNFSRLTQLGYKQWRGNVLGKFNNRCIVCGAKKTKNNKLIPHHLNSWDIHEDERYNVDNGVAICEKHHKEFHNIYGYGKNTKEQFIEWLINKINDNTEVIL